MACSGLALRQARQRGDPLFWVLVTAASRVTSRRAASLPAPLSLRRALPSVCLCFWVCLSMCKVLTRSLNVSALAELCSQC